MVTTPTLERRRQAHRDGKHASHQESLLQQSSIPHQMPSRRRMLRERLRICERVHQRRQMNKHVLLHHLPRHGQNPRDSVLRLLSVQERQGSILVQLWAMSPLYRIATIARDQLRNDTHSHTLKKTQNRLPPLQGLSRQQCRTP